MKRTITLVAIALFIIGAIAFVLTRLHRAADGEVERTIDSFVPEESVYIVHENSGSFSALSQMFGDVITPNSMKIYGELVDTMKFRGVVSDTKAERFAVCDSSGAYIAVHSVVEPISGSIVERLLKGVAGSAVKLQDKEVALYADSALNCFVTTYDRVVIIGNSLNLIRSSVEYVPSRDSLGIDAEFRNGGEDADFNLFVPATETNGRLVLDMDVAPEHKTAVGQGYLSINESMWYAKLEGQHSRQSSFDSNFPSDFDAVEWLALTSFLDYYRSFGGAAEGADYDSFTAFVNCCDSLLSGDVALVHSAGKRYLLVGVKDEISVAAEMESIYASKRVDNLSLSSLKLFGPFFSEMTIRSMELKEGYLLMAESREAITQYHTAASSSLTKHAWYDAYRKLLPARFTFMQFVEADRLFSVYKSDKRGLAHKFLSKFEKGRLPFGIVGVSGEYLGEELFIAVAASGERRPVKVETPVKPATKPSVKPGNTNSAGPSGDWCSKLKGTPVVGPYKVVNHNTKATEWIVQDSKSVLYLFAGNGNKLWEASVDGRITSDIVQVDRYKNGKLQYLFSTPTKIYLVDRNGVMVSSYPIKLASNCNMGITVCDYDKNKNYRIFVPRADRKIELYGIDGKRVSGWTTPRLNSRIVSRVEHFRVSGKDYIVVADQKKLYIYDRRGNVRVNCTKQFNLSEGTELSLTKYKGKSVICVKSGSVRYYIDFTGKEVK